MTAFADADDLGSDRVLNTRLLAAALLPMLLVVPFINKAFHVDDPLFVWTAQQIVDHPFDFYGFSANWSRSEVPMYRIQQNPPLLSYYLAPWGAWFGWGEIMMHLALLPLTGLAGAGIYLLARQFCDRPMLALALSVVSPAFLISATQVMSDVPMVALYAWALYLWLRGLKEDTAWRCILSGILIGLGALTKYFAASAVPLLLVFTILQGPRGYRHLGYLLIPIGMLVTYEFITYRLYGLGLLADAFSFAQEHRETQRAALHIKVLNTIVFIGGCLLPVLCFLPWMMNTVWLRRVLASGGTVVAACFLLPSIAPEWAETWHPLKTTFPLNFEHPGFGLYRVGVAIQPGGLEMAQWGLWFAAGLLILLLPLVDLIQRRDNKSLLLFLWVLGTTFFVAVVNHHVNARVVLPMIPAVAFLVMRRIAIEGREPGGATPLLRAWPLLPALAISLVLAVADYRLAATARQAATEIMAREHSGTVWFSGHSGFHYYMQANGAFPIDMQRSLADLGDIFVQPSNNWYPVTIGPQLAGDHEILTYGTIPFVTTSHFQRYAGFYSDYTGPTPFMFGPVPAEEYMLVDIAARFRLDNLR